ncbi:hypothetical protein [Lysinibacillus contaminans]|uniref:hypothetical protein n=1 Tax=Lysinibacillus contaminans TaxID=1293441 RepID=UPI000A987D16|nr:hypothetical protein [Lysinibacillus contaminans]
MATAPTGYFHVGSSMMGTLLADLGNGVSIDLANRKFSEIMSNYTYLQIELYCFSGKLC